MSEPPALPGRREEAWRWADLSAARRVLEVSAAHAAPANDAAPDLSRHWLLPPEAAERRSFVAGEAVPGTSPHVPEPDREAAAHPLADLAAGAARAGTTLRLADGEDGGTVEILHVGLAGAAHSVTRLVLGKGARLTLLETLADDEADHWLNHRLDASLGEGAQLTRVVRFCNAHGLASDRAAITLGAGAQLRHLTVGLAEAAIRAEVQVRLTGEGAHADVNGILLGRGGAALDALSLIDHAVPQATSGQIWRLVTANRAQVSVSGGVHVARHAQKTNAEQSLKALVLDRTASANLKPQLEISADDVRCAHGCTVGELDAEALFYLQSRGVPEADARGLLTRAFVADALGLLDDQSLAEALDAETQGWIADMLAGRGQAA